VDTEPVVVVVPEPDLDCVVEGGAEERERVWFELEVLDVLGVFQETGRTGVVPVRLLLPHPDRLVPRTTDQEPPVEGPVKPLYFLLLSLQLVQQLKLKPKLVHSYFSSNPRIDIVESKLEQASRLLLGWNFK
jgi:hypothetical protein